MMESVCDELGIPKHHVEEVSAAQNRYLVIVDKGWLKCLEKQKKIRKFPSYANCDKHLPPELGHTWAKVYFQIYKKYNYKVVPLTRNKADAENEMPLTFSQIMSYTSNTNYRNMWKSFYKKYNAAHVRFGKQSGTAARKIDSSVNLVPYDVVLRELIQRMFCCSIIHSKLDTVDSPIPPQNAVSQEETHSNLLPAIIAVETNLHITVIFYAPAIETSLYDCITYSPAIINKSYNKNLFIIYQLFQLVKYLHDHGLTLGEATLKDIYIHENLWLQIIPNLESNITSLDINENTPDECHDTSKFDLKFAYDMQQFSLREYCEMWCNGQLSNFDYLSILNNTAGRRIGCPEYHHIMPWVTDFSHRNGMNWRDLTKSKYRLNKGDPQLDFMFTPSNDNDVPHHVSDFLSEITYFVYMARRTPQKVLCQHVRPIWVPAEYPVSIQRLQEWTPDECIPEFYSDPMIFKSIHEDLADLELPTWATCPEDFIAKHREALESQFVSERLHHWIDLNFGYKLTGQAAIKSKNVCLSVVDNHKNLCRRGIVQLFSHPHPARRFPSVWFTKTPPRISSNESKRRMTRSSEDLSTTPISYDVDAAYGSPARKFNVSPRVSNSNIPEELNASNIERSTSYHTNVQKSSNSIHLPKDFNPCILLNGIESMETFFGKVFLNQKSDKSQEEKLAKNDLLFEDSTDNSFTNKIFSDNFESNLLKDDKRLHNQKYKNLIVQNTTKNYKQVMADKRNRDLQVIGCLIVELFLMNKLRPLINYENDRNFEKRLETCRIVAKSYFSDIPKCLQMSVDLFLYLNDAKRPNKVVTQEGLPSPSPHQVLQPILSNSLIPFPAIYVRVYALLRALHNFETVSSLLDLHTHFQCDGSNCEQYQSLDRKRIVFSREIAECKVKACGLHMKNLLEPIGYEQFNAVELILSHIIDLLKTEETSILAAWYLFDKVAAALGIRKTQTYLLEPILRLYGAEMNERHKNFFNSDLSSSMQFATSSSFKSRKSVKLYHHSFLLRLMVRFGLKCFLDNFVPSLVEAVGGYKEPEENSGFHFHGKSLGDFKKFRSSANLKHCCNDESENSATLISPDRSEMKSDRTLSPEHRPKQEVEEFFTFDMESRNSNCESDIKSVDSLDLRLNHSNAEEATEEQINYLTLDDIMYSDENNSNISSDESKVHTTETTPIKININEIKSPTIEIPTACRRSYELNTIDCEIGSKKSVDTIDLVIETTNNCMKGENFNEEASDSLQNSDMYKITEARNSRNNRISEMSAESLIWLSHRLGPVLTARYLTRNLLKMLTLCYAGQENLLPELYESKPDDNLNYFTIADSIVMGDHNAIKVLECLVAIAALFGEQFILLQYFPHVTELISLCKKRITPSLEGALISSLQLLKYLIPHLADATIMEHIQEVLLGSIIHPIIRLLGSCRRVMPNGFLARSVLARKLLDALYVLAVRIGPEMSKEHLCIPALQRFFLIFDKAYGISDNFYNRPEEGFWNSSTDDSSYVDLRRDGQCKESNIKVSKISQIKLNAEISSNESITTPRNNIDSTSENLDSNSRERALDEIRDVFTPSLAHSSYLAFLRYLGDSIMSKAVINLSLILNLCHEYEQPDFSSYNKGSRSCSNFTKSKEYIHDEEISSNSFGTSVVGNRIEVSHTTPKNEIGPMEVLDMVAYKLDQINTVRHVRGNWLAYWEYEMGRSEKDNHLNLKQIKLQTFSGHTNSVRSILCLDNENSFMSASKDKTVKLWSLRSEGDGKKVSSCRYTYTSHKKSVHSLAFLESMRLTVSCDSGVHLWDPFVGNIIWQLDSQTKYTPVSVVQTYPSPSPLVVAGTVDSSVKIIDSRISSYVNEWKITSSPNSTVKTLACSPSGNWIAVGLTSGNIVLLEGRTGIVLSSWKATDGELLQLIALNDQQIISSSLDHSITMWNVNDVNHESQLKQPPEPAHCLQLNGNELVFATPANRIGIYSTLCNTDSSYSVTKLRSETLKGVLTSLAVLPLNRMLLVGNDNGNIVLLC